MRTDNVSHNYYAVAIEDKSSSTDDVIRSSLLLVASGLPNSGNDEVSKLCI